MRMAGATGVMEWGKERLEERREDWNEVGGEAGEVTGMEGLGLAGTKERR